MSASDWSLLPARVSNEPICVGSKVEGTRVYLVPELPTCTGWVNLATLTSPTLQ